MGYRLKTLMILACALFGLVLLFTISAQAQTPDIESRPFLLGAHTAGNGLSYTMNDLRSFETAAGRRADIFLWYQHIYSSIDDGGNFIEQSLDTDVAQAISMEGRVLQLSWEPVPQDHANNPNFNPALFQLRDFYNGEHDDALRRWARDLRDFGKDFLDPPQPGYPMIIRPFPEMNGDWVWWYEGTNGNQPGDFIAAWRHMHNIFVSEGATNVKWMWSPNRDGSVGDAINTFDNFYPGDAYVDYIGLCGYNWGTLYDTPTWVSTWQSFTEVFGDSYNVMSERSKKPIIISEVATYDVGGDKPAWITNAFDLMRTTYPRIVGLTWFNVIHLEDGQTLPTDWRIETSPASQDAFKTGLGALDQARLGKCGRPGLVLNVVSSQWTSYADYLNRIVTTDVSILDNGVSDAYQLRIVGSTNSNGVALVSALPISLGNYVIGTSSQAKLKYQVPPGTGRFVAQISATAEDGCGTGYEYPITNAHD